MRDEDIEKAGGKAEGGENDGWQLGCWPTQNTNSIHFIIND